jgi:thioredoxin-dependent peroxiredoxin
MKDMMVEIGKEAPDFELPDQGGETVRLSDYRGQKVVIFAFPKANSYQCTKQVCGFRDEYPEINTHRAIVLGVSADSRFELSLMKRINNIPYPLLSDTKHEMLALYGAWGMDIMGLLKLPIIKRSYWGIDADGILHEMRIGIEPAESIQIALDFVRQSSATENNA